MSNKLSLAERILAKGAPKTDDYEASLLSPAAPEEPFEADELEALIEAVVPAPKTLAERILAKRAAK
jgi:hypothetical protein